MKKLTILIIAGLLVLSLVFVLAQTQQKKPDNRNKPDNQSNNSPKELKPASSQDPFVVAPQAYKREFENERVRVTRVRYEAHEVIESHEHPKAPTVYVYLSDSGPIRFVHTGDEKFINVRPVVKAGAFRLGRLADETHKVESLSDQASDFLRVELKDLTVDKTFRGRFPPEENQAAENAEKVGFESPQLRIVRVTCAARRACALTAQNSPYLLVALASSELKTAINDAALSNLKMTAGQTLWVESGARLRLENLDNKPIRFLRIDLKTAS